MKTYTAKLAEIKRGRHVIDEPLQVQAPQHGPDRLGHEELAHAALQAPLP